MNWLIKIDVIHVSYLPNLSIIVGLESEKNADLIRMLWFHSIPTAAILQIENREQREKRHIAQKLKLILCKMTN